MVTLRKLRTRVAQERGEAARYDNKEPLFEPEPCQAKNGGGRGSRTPDPRLMSPLLYQLSYPAMSIRRACGQTACAARPPRVFLCRITSRDTHSFGIGTAYNTPGLPGINSFLPLGHATPLTLILVLPPKLIDYGTSRAMRTTFATSSGVMSAVWAFLIKVCWDRRGYGPVQAGSVGPHNIAMGISVLAAT